jgi:hypothetical protein
MNSHHQHPDHHCLPCSLVYQCWWLFTLLPYLAWTRAAVVAVAGECWWLFTLLPYLARTSVGCALESGIWPATTYSTWAGASCFGGSGDRNQEWPAGDHE